MEVEVLAQYGSAKDLFPFKQALSCRGIEASAGSGGRRAGTTEPNLTGQSLDSSRRNARSATEVGRTGRVCTEAHVRIAT